MKKLLFAFLAIALIASPAFAGEKRDFSKISFDFDACFLDASTFTEQQYCEKKEIFFKKKRKEAKRAFIKYHKKKHRRIDSFLLSLN